MPDTGAIARYTFIGHALRGDGPFRPAVWSQYDATTATQVATLGSASYLVRYPRESDAKFARRNEVAFYDSPLAQACSRFVGYLSTQPPMREAPHELYARMLEDIDGRGTAIDVWWWQFLRDAKARGAGLLLVDMPREMAPTLAAQIEQRQVPYWTSVLPEALTEWEIGDDGRFIVVSFAGVYTAPDGAREDCVWTFDAATWRAEKRGAGGAATLLAEGTHPCGECPLLIWTETGSFPGFGQFAAIADLSRRLFNLESELDEILRSQTFSLLTMQVPDGTTEQQKLAAAQTAGQTIGTSNLLVHSGSAPSFIAPPDGPARVYIDRIAALRARIDVLGLNVAAIDQQESGIAMQMRFAAINAELVNCAALSESVERRAWALSARWLGMQAQPTTAWSRDYQIADVQAELQILADMQASAMPPAVIAAQQRRVVQVQFGGEDDVDDLLASVEERERGIDGSEGGERSDGNVVPIDRNSGVRDAIVRALNG